MQCWYRSRLFACSVTAFLAVMAGLLLLAVSSQSAPAARAFSAVRQAPAAPAVQAAGTGQAQHHAAAAAQQPRTMRTVTRIPAPYTVRAADTLWKIAAARCHNGRDWSGIYLASRKIIGKNPDLIVPGQLLAVSCTSPHVALPEPPVPQPSRISQPQESGQTAPASHSAPVQHYSGSYGGHLSYAGLESLWESAGGPYWAAPHAAGIAECESGGNQMAYNPSGASGYWQILGQVIAGWIFDPMVNALNAVAKFRASGDTFAQWVCT